MKSVDVRMMQSVCDRLSLLYDYKDSHTPLHNNKNGKYFSFLRRKYDFVYDVAILRPFRRVNTTVFHRKTFVSGHDADRLRSVMDIHIKSHEVVSIQLFFSCIEQWNHIIFQDYFSRRIFCRSRLTEDGYASIFLRVRYLKIL